MSTAASAAVPNAFIGSKTAPSDADLQHALGPAKPAWDALLAHLATEHNAATHEWKTYSVKAGWSLRVLRGKRTIIWLAPCHKCFRAAVILGDKAMRAARERRLSAAATRALDAGEKYPEGTGMRLLVAAAKDLGAVEELVAVKVEN